MRLSNLFIPFDAYERNKKISTLINAGETILDVGGGATGIKLFTKNEVTIVDLKDGDIKKDARELKLPRGSYDTVICVDTLEHIPPIDRKKFITNLVDIAKNKVIISAPYGSAAHNKAEKGILKKLKSAGKEDLFLKQHVEYGLPTPKDALVKKHKAETFYSGDFRVSNMLFRIQMFESKILIIDKILLPLRRIMNFVLNLLVYPFWFYKRKREYANRFYVLIEKTK